MMKRFSPKPWEDYIRNIRNISGMLSASTATAIFLLDVMTPRGIAVPMLYAIPILLTTLVSGLRITGIVGGCAIGLTGLGLYASSGELTPAVIADRTLASLLLCVVIGLVIRQKLLVQQMTREQDALRVSEERFRLLVERVQDYSIVLLDHDGHVQTWNIGAARLQQYTPDEIIGESIARFYTDEDRASNVPQQLLASARQNGRVEQEGWRVRKDGTRFMADVIITALYDDDYRIRGFAKITRDITVRKRMEEQLRAVFEASPSGLLIADGKGRIQKANEFLMGMFGYSGEELIGQPVESLMPVRYRDRHPAQRTDFTHNPSARPMGVGRDLFGLRKNGTEFPIEVGLSPIKAVEGASVLCSIIDITKRLQTEESLRRQEVLERLFEEREATAMTVHDGILQSLYAVRLGLEQCHRTLTDRPEAAVRMLNDRIQDVGLIIAEVRDFMTKQDPLWLQADNLADGFAELVRSFQVSEGLVFHLHCADGVEGIGLPEAERKQIFLIAREGVSNVLRHSSATICRITLGAIEGRLHLSIEDDGIGFQPAVIHGQCRGVGNMEARARQIGATLDIASEMGRGTRITLETVRREVHV